MNRFLYCDNIWVEGERGWFVPWGINVVFEWDIKRGVFYPLKELPDCEWSGRLRKNSKCMKCGNDLYCFPCEGECIWVLNLQTLDIQRIEIENPSGKRIIMLDFWNDEGKIYAFSRGLKQLIEIDADEREISRYHKINIENPIICTQVGHKAYIFSSVEPTVYEYDVDISEGKIYHIPNLNTGINCVCHDGKQFWLSGRGEEIYLWDTGQDTTQILNKDLLGSGDEEWRFCGLINTKGYVWCIPCKTNDITYINKTTKEVKCFQIKEKESGGRLRNDLGGYRIEYYCDNRCVGLYSMMSRKILEINMDKMVWNYKNASIQVDGGCTLLNGYNGEMIVENEYNKEVFRLLLLGENTKRNTFDSDIKMIGADIHNNINMS